MAEDLVLEPPYFTVVPHHLIPGTSLHLVGTSAVESSEWPSIYFAGELLGCPIYIKACVEVSYVRTEDLAYFDFAQTVAQEARVVRHTPTRQRSTPPISGTLPDLRGEPPYFTRVLIQFVPRTIWHQVGTSAVAPELQTICLASELIGCPIYIKAWVERVYVRTEDLEAVSGRALSFRSSPTTRCTPAPAHRW